MAALLVDALPTGDEWLYEAKFDGYRALALKDGASVKILSRKGNDLTADYPAIRQAVAALKAKSAVVDGEIVAFDESGRPSFQQLHHRSANPAAIRYFAFDLLHLNGKDLQAEPLDARRAALQKVLSGSDVVFSAELPGSAEDVIQAVADVGLEGVVAKRRDSRYEARKAQRRLAEIQGAASPGVRHRRLQTGEHQLSIDCRRILREQEAAVCRTRARRIHGARSAPRCSSCCAR